MALSGIILAFDVDGVLVDVNESYREAIRHTVRHFTHADISAGAIQDLKNQIGWNNDWDVCHHLVRAAGLKSSYEEIVDYFNAIFLGDNGSGLIGRERWLPLPGLLERLACKYQPALFTGRTHEELNITLSRFAPHFHFDPIIVSDGVLRPKPAPDGLLRIAELHPGKAIWYVGDTIDDARSAAAAAVPFIGVAAPSNPRAETLATLLAEEGARAVLQDINQIEQALPS